MKVIKIEKTYNIWNELEEYAEKCSWEAGKHLSYIMREGIFDDWEGIFTAIENNKIIGFCTFLKTDYYPENRYFPWISSIFVDENYRGQRVSQIMIETVVQYAKSKKFSKVYIPSDMIGFYEKYGLKKIDTLQNYSGDIDNIFVKSI